MGTAVRHRTTARAAVGATTLALASTLLALGAPPAAAAGDGIAISEINYHASSDLDQDDFLELANPGDADVSLSGWSFTAGITGTFSDITIPAGGYVVIAKDAAQFQTTYGFAPDATYGGNLSNGGEEVTIVDADGLTVDTVTYSDSPPWPTSPDGDGPSLELRSLNADNTLPESWGPSAVDGGTPRATNSIDGTDVMLPAEEVTVAPARPTPNQPAVVSARLRPGTSATLTYKVMFGSEVAIPFSDDAASPGGAGDGVYSATIPGQAAGRLVRFRIDGTAPGVTVAEPSPNDSMQFRGYVVTTPSVSSQLPIIEWFMADEVYDDLLANHRHDDVMGDAVWAYDGQVWDGVGMRIRGNSSRNEAKVNWKVEFPRGYTFDLGGQLPYPLDEFALQNYKHNFADIGWATVHAAGARSLNIRPVRTQRNGSFWSLGRVMETEDGEWRKDQGVEDWAIYKAEGGALARRASPADLEAKLWLDKKTRKDEDFTDVWNLTNVVDRPSSESQRAWLYRNANISVMINYMAINSILRHTDSGWYNWWVARDTEGTGRWELWHWDLDRIFTDPASDGKGPFLTPDSGNRFVRAMLNHPEFQEMFYRRLRTLSDEFLAAGAYEAQWDAITARALADWNLDKARWGGYNPAGARQSFVTGLAERRGILSANTPDPVPASQATAPNVVINEIQYRPASNDVEFLELTNPNQTAVDISGWTIPAVGLTIQAGTVIPAGGYVTFVGDDTAFRAAFPNGNRFVGGQFSGSLDNSGETIELRAGTTVIDTVAYSPTDPWPTEADGNGPSLELTDVNADNSVAANWRAASTTGGTPGLTNTSGPTADTSPPTAPNGLTATEITDHEVALEWAAATDNVGVTDYHVLRNGSVVATVTGRTFTDIGLSPETTYRYTVRARDAAGNTGPASSPLDVTTATPPSNALLVDTFTGTNGSSWESSWTTRVSAGTVDRQSNQGRLNYTDTTDAFARAQLTGLAPRTDSETLLSFQWSAAGQVGASTYFNVWTRGSGGGNNSQRPRNGYGLELTANRTTVNVLSVVNGTETVLAAAGGVAAATTSRQWLRMRVVGSTIQVKVWTDGTPEPAGWEHTTTDSAVTDPGQLYLSLRRGRSNVGTKSVHVDDLTVTPGA